jgi:hypothetical protein
VIGDSVEKAEEEKGKEKNGHGFLCCMPFAFLFALFFSKSRGNSLLDDRAPVFDFEHSFSFIQPSTLPEGQGQNEHHE